MLAHHKSFQFVVICEAAAAAIIVDAVSVGFALNGFDGVPGVATDVS